MQIRAFHGLRYAGDPAASGALAAPPYDQIDDRARDRFHAVEHQFVHLTRPVDAGGLTAHERSAELHRRWLEDETVVCDRERSLYANAIALPDGSVRFGLTTLLDIESADSGIIRPHEETVEKTVAERLALLRTTGIDYEPILVLAEDDGGELDRLLAADCAAGEPLARHEDEFGNIHTLFQISEPDRIERYRKLLADRPGLIADGHHRYKTAALFAREVGAGRGSAAGAKLAVVTSLASDALTIDPIHRALPIPIDLTAIDDEVRDRGELAAGTGSEIAAAVASADQPTLAVIDGSGATTMLGLDPDRGPESLPPAASRLAVVLLHAALLPRLGFAPEAATDGTLAYRSDPDDLWGAVDRGHFPTGIVLPPMRPELFADAIADGDVLPPKSTRFLPKVVSGLVWAAHDDPVD